MRREGAIQANRTRWAQLVAVLIAIAASAVPAPAGMDAAVVHGEIRLPDAGCPAVAFTVRDGGTLRVRDDARGITFGFVLSVDPADGGRLGWTPLELGGTLPDGGPRLEASPRTTFAGLVESFELRSALAAGTFRFELQVLGVESGPALDTGSVPTDGSAECCVTCDGWTVCGSCVEMWCGSCCGGGGASDIAPATGRRP